MSHWKHFIIQVTTVTITMKTKSCRHLMFHCCQSSSHLVTTLRNIFWLLHCSADCVRVCVCVRVNTSCPRCPQINVIREAIDAEVIGGERRFTRWAALREVVIKDVFEVVVGVGAETGEGWDAETSQSWLPAPAASLSPRWQTQAHWRMFGSKCH